MQQINKYQIIYIYYILKLANPRFFCDPSFYKLYYCTIGPVVSSIEVIIRAIGIAPSSYGLKTYSYKFL